MTDRILIQIASYRDPELLPTIQDCIANAADPSRLRFCIAWQHGEEEKLPDQYYASDQFTILDIDYRDAQGVCWARSLVQQQYAGEEFTMMLDSHHRFAKNWDLQLIKMWSDLVATGVQKPLLTAYIPSFNPENDPAGRHPAPWRMTFDRFTPEGVVFFLPADIPNWQQLRFPVPARFVSAHFIFAAGKLCLDVPYDPNYYFHGEEINLSARTYTHGYDLFHPHRAVVWHEYTRRGRAKSWDDDKVWVKRNEACHTRNRKLFEMDGEKKDIDFGPYDFGKERTLADYEKWAGINFKRRGVQQWTLDHKYPPNQTEYATPEEYEKSFLKIFRHCIDIQYSQVPETDYDFWVVAFHDKDGKEIHRRDADEREIASFKHDPDKYCKVWRTFHCDGDMPVRWVVWPHSRSKDWCEKIEGKL